MRFSGCYRWACFVLLTVTIAARSVQAGPASMVVDLYPRSQHGELQIPMAVLHGTAYFFEGTELWGTDGTTTWAVKDLQPWAMWPGEIVASDSALFAVFGGDAVAKLWQADGTNAGFHVIDSLIANGGFGTGQCTAYMGDLHPLGSGLLFTKEATCEDDEFINPFSFAYVADGSAVRPFGDVGAMEPFGDELYFVDAYRRLSRTDGTSTSELTLDVPDGGGIQDGPDAGCEFVSCGSQCALSCDHDCYGATCVPRSGIGFVTPVGSQQGLYWLAADYSAVPNPWDTGTVRGDSLWFTDGISGEASEVTALPALMTPLGVSAAGVFLYSGNDVWSVIDGTASLLDGDDQQGLPQDIGAIGRFFLYERLAQDGVVTLKSTDGTVSGTQVLGQWSKKQVTWYGPTQGVPLNGGLVFGCSDQICWSDGTPAGTRVLAETGGCQLPSPVSTNAHTVLFPFQYVDGADVWVTDGTPAGTHPLESTEQGISSIGVGPTNVGGIVTFATTSANGGPTSYVTDGTAAGTLPGTSPFTPIGSANGLDFFTTGINLYVGDGTANGTSPYSPTVQYNATQVVASGNWIYFLVTDGSAQELWRSRGGSDTMTKVAPLPTTGFQFLGGTSDMVVLQNGMQLWKFQSGSLQMIRDFGAGSGAFGHSAAADGFVFFFFGVDGSADFWITDGTSQGTQDIGQQENSCAWIDTLWVVPLAGGVDGRSCGRMENRLRSRSRLVTLPISTGMRKAGVLRGRRTPPRTI